MPTLKSYPPIPEDAPGDLSSLTPKQQAFVREYLVDLNAYQASRRAGYSQGKSKACGSKLLKYPKIAAIIHRALRARAASTLATQEKVIEELSGLAGSDVFDLFDVNNGVLILRDLSNVPPHIRRTVKSVKQTKYGIEITMHDKVMALGLLARHLGMLQPDDPHDPRNPKNVTPTNGPVMELPDNGSSHR